MAKSTKTSVSKSAITGRFVSKRTAARNPKTTYTQTVTRKKK